MSKEKLSQIISRQLLQDIESGKYPAGSKLPTEMELAAQFGVSRIPIREALSVLRAAGVITSRQGGGSFVEERADNGILNKLTIENEDAELIKHLFEMRKVLEPEAAYLAAQRRTNEHLERMWNALHWLEEELADANKISLEADLEFHRTMFLATQNPVMIQAMENLSSLYERALNITLKPNLGMKEKRKAVYKEHHDILLAIEMEEPELAKIQCAIHLRNVEKKLSLFM
ncbi:FadR family transcriptional regulator [Brevibacillus composti]|uniref:FadR family transcriptional regulator n=1 Tax=Brevibacillus composti TaxID=2796470 RepID=A0A7T5EKU8_9BACL|nr:FadR/GntR family transcriptional regulator [Brevibacillus composti]QQE74391.1 FadR family transcriptional regulator [Brevibacillus composti]QUO41473.1 FadR family transcriptional regulator [Brevibacillus composti]